MSVNSYLVGPYERVKFTRYVRLSGFSYLVGS